MSDNADFDVLGEMEQCDYCGQWPNETARQRIAELENYIKEIENGNSEALDWAAKLEQQLAELREAAYWAKRLLDDATFHNGSYGQQNAQEWQTRACEASDDIAALLKQEGE